MKKMTIMLVVMLVLAFNLRSSAQVAASIYNVNRNDFGNYDFDDHSRHNRPGKILVAAGMIAGGLAIGVAASQQEYFIGNTTVFGVGGVLTLVATGLVIGGTNCLNREIKLSYTGNGIGLSVCLNPTSSYRKQLKPYS